jgi:hypothetical protein
MQVVVSKIHNLSLRTCRSHHSPAQEGPEEAPQEVAPQLAAEQASGKREEHRQV